MSSGLNDMSLVVTHFRDFRWIALWANRIETMTEKNRVREILIINQDRTEESAAKLKQICPRARILSYPRDEKLFAFLGHDHPYVLQRAVEEAKGSIICIFDSDAHPTSKGWVEACEKLMTQGDAVLAEDPQHPGMSHPCFMVLTRQQIHDGLRFDLNMFEKNRDTGREIVNQLRDRGARPHLLKAADAFSGQYGCLYLHAIYHHGHGSFAHGGPELRQHLNWRQPFFQNLVVDKQRYKLGLGDRLKCWVNVLRYDSPLALRKGIVNVRSKLGLARQQLGRKSQA